MISEHLICRPGGLRMTKELFEMAGLSGGEESGKGKNQKKEAAAESERPLQIVDIGCGAGVSIDYLKECHPSWDICGIDPNPQVQKEGTIRIGEAEQLPFADSSLDVVLMECSFSKTGDPKQALSEVFRVLKTDGWLLMSDMYAKKQEIFAGVPDGSGETGVLCCKGSRTVLGRLEFHQTIISRLQDAGFSVLEMQDRSGELAQWIGQKIFDGEAEALYENLGMARSALKAAGCGYFLCAAKPSDLWETLRYAGEKSPFYRTHMEMIPKAGDWDGFRSLPFTTPEDVRENPDRLLCVNPKEIARIITLYTSGSKGNPKRLFFTEADLLWTADFFEKGMQYMVKPGDRVTVYMEGPGRFSIGGLLKEGLNRIRVDVTVHGLIRDMEAAAADGEGRNCFVGVPSQMYGLAAKAPHLRPGTVLLSADYVPESVKEFLEKTWQCRVFTHWGMTETGYGGGVQCRSREGYHLRDGDLLLEIIDPDTGMLVPDGEYGELVLTTLHRRGMPLIRYRTGDLGRFLTEPCGCGCLKPRLDKIKGRLDDSVRLEDGQFLSMHILDELLFSVDGVQDFEASFDPEEGALTIFVMKRDGQNGVPLAVKECLETHFGNVIRIEAEEKEISPYIGSGKRKMILTRNIM